MRHRPFASGIRRVVHLLMFLLLMNNYCFGQGRDSTSRHNPELRFLEKRIIDYGHIKAKDQITINVQFENAGLSPLCILSVTTTCNCTKAQTDKKLYEHNEKGKVQVQIDAEGKYGPQTAVIRITTNADRPQSIVRIDYYVEN
ncbi:MAG TPA: hypothetical protein DD383_06825 [Rikenellaceae bacterium]|nr:hypothetical protein [Rikenellaceae bacterium]HCQ73108.1 hypothetical protein [Rikenellaceae bacterium]